VGLEVGRDDYCPRRFRRASYGASASRDARASRPTPAAAAMPRPAKSSSVNYASIPMRAWQRLVINHLI